MKHVIALLIPTLCLFGCVSSTELTREWTLEKANQYAEINEQGKEYRAMISVRLDTMIAEYDGDYVTVGRDSVHWVDPETKLVRSAAIMNLRRIRFVKHDPSAAGGIMGAIPGVVLFVIGSIGDGGDTRDFQASTMRVGVAVALGGALVGGVIGAIIGHKTDYIFPAP